MAIGLGLDCKSRPVPARRPGWATVRELHKAPHTAPAAYGAAAGEARRVRLSRTGKDHRGRVSRGNRGCCGRPAAAAVVGYRNLAAESPRNRARLSGPDKDRTATLVAAPRRSCPARSVRRVELRRIASRIGQRQRTAQDQAKAIAHRSIPGMGREGPRIIEAATVWKKPSPPSAAGLAITRTALNR